MGAEQSVLGQENSSTWKNIGLYRVSVNMQNKYKNTKVSD